MDQLEPSLNLWTDPWITLESRTGELTEVSTQETLLRANDFLSIHDPSPLVVVGIHRLLTAILQDILAPQRPADLQELWKSRCFPEGEVRQFGARYTDRFELFSPDVPFLQSGDLPRSPAKQATGVKPVTYLTPEIPAGSEVTHYRHGVAEDKTLCPICAAQSLVTIPPFATSGGRGIKPSINGVPPIYVVPGGETLFESLAASLVLPAFQPAAASKEDDGVWWRHGPVIERRVLVREVSYLHSLTFPARRVRLHPEHLGTRCSRCGRRSEWGVRSMVYRMGESRPKDAPSWFDPFVAYRLRGAKPPVPLRPEEGKVLWREFACLFLPPPDAEPGTQQSQPPSVLYQLANVGPRDDLLTYPFRCVGMRTDMRAKVFEWVDVGFDVPLAFVHDLEGSEEVRQAVHLATQCAGIISGVFRRTFGGKGKTEHHETLRRRMESMYWGSLATSFRELVIAVADPDARVAARGQWANTVVDEARNAFWASSELVGRDGAALRDRVTGRRTCAMRLGAKRKEYLPSE